MNRQFKIRIFAILLAAFSLMFGVSLLGHSPADDIQIISDEAVYGNPFALRYNNPGGMMGAYLSYVSMFFMGWAAFLSVPFLLILSLRIFGWELARRLYKHAAMIWGVGWILLLLLDIPRIAGLREYPLTVPDGSGALGQTLIEISLKIVGVPGTYIVFLAALTATLLYYGAISHRFHNLVALIAQTGKALIGDAYERAKPRLEEARKKLDFRNRPVIRKSSFKSELKRNLRRKNANLPAGTEDVDLGNAEQDTGSVIIEREGSLRGNDKKPQDTRKVTLSRKTEAEDTGRNAEVAAEPGSFKQPPPDLLSYGTSTGPAYSEKELSETAQSLQLTLETFGVRLAGKIEMYPGPVITRFEIKPAAGIKVNQIANLSEDLALNLRAKSIRIVAPIPGKAAVGIEIPNRNPQIVNFRELIESDAYRNQKMQLPMALGKDIAGDPFVTDLADMPHLLIAGTTGSGKSVCVNAVITSLIYALHPSRLRFIFVDPKMLELTVYKGIPYLSEKVVTRAKQAERVLGEAVTEMESRYRLLAAKSVRNIVDYNSRAKDESEKLPYIVIVIDELADLMMSAQSSKVELLITRLAQMARAVGIHLILATQRPSVDVITGLIKANFPSRIAFQVASKTDSRTILDGNGAEKLLGRGDMLFLKVGQPEPARLHGAFLSSDDTEKLVTFLRDQEYSQTRQKQAEEESKEKAELSKFSDPVLIEAIETVVRQGQASVSLLQRRLGIGYQRAARLIDDLEDMKIIGSYNESKARDVLVDRSFLETLKQRNISKT